MVGTFRPGYHVEQKKGKLEVMLEVAAFHQVALRKPEGIALVRKPSVVHREGLTAQAAQVFYAEAAAADAEAVSLGSVVSWGMAWTWKPWKGRA